MRGKFIGDVTTDERKLPLAALICKRHAQVYFGKAIFPGSRVTVSIGGKIIREEHIDA